MSTGGDFESLSSQLQHFVEESWPIIVLEGSGGYADMLVQLILRAKGSDGRRNDEFLGQLEPLTAQIVSSGHVTIVRSGMIAAECERVIQRALRGDLTLQVGPVRVDTTS